MAHSVIFKKFHSYPIAVKEQSSEA
jgi:hypothetical protein